MKLEINPIIELNDFHSETTFLVQKFVHLWILEIDDSLSKLEKSNYSQNKLRGLLTKYTGAEEFEHKFIRGENGKPMLERSLSRDIFFNLSYTSGLFAIALSNEEVGIDVEKINLNFQYAEMLDSCFSENQIARLSPINHADFFNYWTRKEAILKALGTGIIDDLPNIPCENGVHELPKAIMESQAQFLHVASFKLPHYMLSIASPIDDYELRINNSIS